MNQINDAGSLADAPSAPSGRNEHPAPANQLVDAPRVLELLFEKSCRPTVRWLRNMQKARRVPFTKIGRLVFFNPVKVRAALEDRWGVKSK